MHLRYTNTAILVLIGVLTLSGVYGIFWTLNGWLFEVHRGAAWALVALIPWKTAISWRSLKRGIRLKFDRGVMIMVSVTLAAVTVMILALGVLWAWRVGPEVLWLSQTVISWHWILALALIPPFALHVWRRWPKPRVADFAARRGALRSISLLGVGLVGWWVAETLARAQATLAAPREFTGSRGSGILTGNPFPVTGEWAAPINPGLWKLTVHGAVAAARTISYAEVLSLPRSQVGATIDCTTGWYSAQDWQGTSLFGLLESIGMQPEAGYVRLKAATGYAATFSLDEAREILLATHVGGQPLDHWHGFPLRSVAPLWRGWYWVKWLNDIEVLVYPHFDLPGVI
jgi:hypothetical protein